MKTYKEFLQEAKQVGELYHYSSIDGANSILDDNTIYASELNDFPSVSTTRNKNLHKSSRSITRNGKIFKVRSGINTDVSFVLDGDKLSNNKKVKPFSYMTGLHKVSTPNAAEYEEQVAGDIENAKSYIKKIRIHNDISDEDLNELKKHNIPIEFHK